MISPQEKFGSNYYSIVYSPYITFFVSLVFVYFAFSILIGNFLLLNWDFVFRVSFVFLGVCLFFYFQKNHHNFVKKQLADANELIYYLGVVSDSVLESVSEEVPESYSDGLEQGFNLLLEELAKQIVCTHVPRTEEKEADET